MSIEVKIGIIQHPHEIDLEIDSAADDLISIIDTAVSEEKPLVWITDTKGNKTGIPAAKIAFVEVRTVEDAAKRVGFGA